MSATELTERITALGAPASIANVLADAERLIARGAEERMSTTVAEITGRTP